MKRLSLVFISLFTGLLLSFGLLSTVSGKANAQASRLLPGNNSLSETIYYVAPGGNCNGMAPCYASIQDAVNAAQDGDVVKVATGIYTSSLNSVVHISKSLTLQGGYILTNWITPNPIDQITLVDGEGERQGIAIITPLSATVVIVKGLHVTGGYYVNSIGCYGFFGGAGLYIYGNGEALIEDNHIYNNHVHGTCGSGGGLWSAAKVTVQNNRIHDNSATHTGGGIYIGGGSAIIASNTITHNIVGGSMPESIFGGGGGIALMDWLSYTGNNWIDNNLIQNNSAIGYYSAGGGIYSEAPVSLNGNLIISNTVQNGFGGGGVYLICSGPSGMTNNVLAHNYSASIAGALFLSSPSYKIIHNTFIDNQSRTPGAIFFLHGDNRIDITNTIFISEAVGIAVEKENTIFINGVLWHNTPITISAASTSTVIVQHEYYGDPRFAADGYHLTSLSAALDRGIATSLTTDIDGDARNLRIAPDLGADEFLVNTVDSRLKLVGLDFNDNQGRLVFDFQAHNRANASLYVDAIQNAAQLSPELAAQVTNVTFSQTVFTPVDYLVTQDYRPTDGRIRFIYTHQGPQWVTLDQTWKTILRVVVQFNSAPSFGSVLNWNSIPYYYAFEWVEGLGWPNVTGQREAVPMELQSISLTPYANRLYLPMIKR